MAEPAQQQFQTGAPNRVIVDERFGRRFLSSYTHPLIVARCAPSEVLHGTGLVATAPIPKGTVLWRSPQNYNLHQQIWTKEEVAHHHKKEEFWIDEDEIASWSEADKERFHVNAYQVAPEKWSGPTPGIRREDMDISFFMNHSCDPNCWFEEGTEGETMVALRDISEGEEVTYDYGTSDVPTELYPEQGGWECLCGSSSGERPCRGVISDAEWRNPWFIERYDGHCTPYVQSKMEELKQKTQEHSL